MGEQRFGKVIACGHCGTEHHVMVSITQLTNRCKKCRGTGWIREPAAHGADDGVRCDCVRRDNYHPDDVRMIPTREFVRRELAGVKKCIAELERLMD